jgi:membrane dipeptidase
MQDRPRPVLDRRALMLAAMGMLASPSIVRASTPTGRGQAPLFIDGLGGPQDDEVDASTPWSPARIAEFHKSGMSAWMVEIADVSASPDAWDNTIRKLAHYQALIAANPDLFVQARTAGDIERARAQGRGALVFGTENTTMMGADLDKVAVLAQLGVKVVQLTYNIRNMSGDGALEPANGGLSKFGRAMIARIEKERLLLDLSHSGDRTILEAVQAATRPLSIDHTGCRALGDHPRNVTDAAIRAVADKGGVVGIYLMPFLTTGHPPTRQDVIAHIEHAVQVGGEDHVGIGTDNFLNAQPFDPKAVEVSRKDYQTRAAAGVAAPGEGPDFFPAVLDYNSPMRFHMLADDLAKRGMPARVVDKIMGANLLRLYRDAWGA